MSIGILIRRIGIAYGRACNTVLQMYDVTHPQLELLRYVYEAQTRGKAVRPRDIELALGVKNPTVTGLLNRLEAKGFLVRENDPQDSRARLIRLTAKEEQLRRQMRESAGALNDRLTGNLTAGEKADLEALLGKVLDNVEKSE